MRTTFFALTLIPALVLGCAGNEADAEEMSLIDPPEMSIPTGTVDTEPPPACGATELCARSIDDCDIALEQGECESWYAEAGTTGDCRYVDDYIACNCDCEASEDTCDGYFACGEFCFIEHC